MLFPIKVVMFKDGAEAKCFQILPWGSDRKVRSTRAGVGSRRLGDRRFRKRHFRVPRKNLADTNSSTMKGRKRLTGKF